MPIHSSNPLGSDDASFEFGVCFVVLRKRVRYWASTLPQIESEETNFLGAVVALRCLCARAPRSCREFIAVGEVDEWQMLFENWADRCKRKIAKQKVSLDELKARAAEEFQELRNFGRDIPRPQWLGSAKEDLASIKERLEH
jgi:hypothetical protein